MADKEFSGELQKMLLNDLGHAKELINYRSEEQSLWERLKAKSSALWAPVL